MIFRGIALTPCCLLRYDHVYLNLMKSGTEYQRAINGSRWVTLIYCNLSELYSLRIGIVDFGARASIFFKGRSVYHYRLSSILRCFYYFQPWILLLTSQSLVSLLNPL